MPSRFSRRRWSKSRKKRPASVGGQAGRGALLRGESLRGLLLIPGCRGVCLAARKGDPPPGAVSVRAQEKSHLLDPILSGPLGLDLQTITFMYTVYDLLFGVKRSYRCPGARGGIPLSYDHDLRPLAAVPLDATSSSLHRPLRRSPASPWVPGCLAFPLLVPEAQRGRYEPPKPGHSTADTGEVSSVARRSVLAPPTRG
jgi:hypothetical protein